MHKLDELLEAFKALGDFFDRVANYMDDHLEVLQQSIDRQEYIDSLRQQWREDREIQQCLARLVLHIWSRRNCFSRLRWQRARDKI